MGGCDSSCTWSGCSNSARQLNEPLFRMGCCSYNARQPLFPYMLVCVRSLLRRVFALGSPYGFIVSPRIDLSSEICFGENLCPLFPYMVIGVAARLAARRAHRRRCHLLPYLEVSEAGGGEGRGGGGRGGSISPLLLFMHLSALYWLKKTWRLARSLTDPGVAINRQFESRSLPTALRFSQVIKRPANANISWRE